MNQNQCGSTAINAILASFQTSSMRSHCDWSWTHITLITLTHTCDTILYLKVGDSEWSGGGVNVCKIFKGSVSVSVNDFIMVSWPNVHGPRLSKVCPSTWEFVVRPPSPPPQPTPPRDCVAFAWAAVSPSHYSPVFTDRLRPGLSEQLWLHYLTLPRIDTDHRTPKANAHQQLHPAGIFKRVWRHVFFSFWTRSGENQILCLFFFSFFSSKEMSYASCCFSKINAAGNLVLVVSKVYVTFMKQVLFIGFQLNLNHCSGDGYIYFPPRATSTLCLTLRVAAVGWYKCNCSLSYCIRTLHRRKNICAYVWYYQQTQAAAFM